MRERSFGGNPGRKRRLRMVAALGAAIAPLLSWHSPALTQESRPTFPVAEVASAIPSLFYAGGIELWGQTWLTIGQPNAYNRCDRSMIRVDLRRWVMSGPVRKAVLRWDYVPHGFQDVRELEIALFRREEEEFDIYSGFAIPADPIRRWLVDGGQGAQPYRLDLTREANRALRQGWGSIAIRIRDCYSDEHGNPGSKVQMVGLVANSIVLEVEE